MIDAVVAWSVRHRGVVFVASALLAGFGGWAYFHLPIDAIPDLSENQQLVYAAWPGRGPAEIDVQVARPLTRRLQNIAGVKTVRCSSEVGYTLIHLIFEDGVGYRTARERVAAAIADPLSLPPDVVVRQGPDGLPTGQVFWYTIDGGALNLAERRMLHDSLVAPRLAELPGIAEVASVGGFKPELHVDVDPTKLRGRRVALQEVARAVEQACASAASQSPLALERLPIGNPEGSSIHLGDVATVHLGAAPRRGLLEKDGNEAVGGVVLMQTGANPREVCQRIRAKIAEIAPSLPPGVRIVPCYDRTTLVDAAVGTLRRTLLEAMAVAAAAVLLVLLHARTVFAVIVALPLAVLASFAGLWTLREFFGWSLDVNIMALAGLAVSIGVLVDSSMVLAENAMVRLRDQFADGPVHGDTRPAILQACRMMARPIVFSILVMLLSFLPLLALGGIEGRMFRPLILTKSLALAAVAVLAITLVPALCSVFIKGRIRKETDGWIVRATAEVYRPLLTLLLDRPLAMLAVIGVPLLVGFAPIGSDPLLQVMLFVLTAAALLLPSASQSAESSKRRPWAPANRLALIAFLLLVAVVARSTMTPLGSEFVAPLDEQTVMDMPITIPGATAQQSADDLKARDMILCRFPEVAMVVGKAGRADTPTDPAPLDMIETMVDLRPVEYWPRRCIPREQVVSVVRAALRQTFQPPHLHPNADPDSFVEDVVDAVRPGVEIQLREAAYQAFHQFDRELGPKSAADWRRFVAGLNAELRDRAAEALVRASLEELYARLPISSSTKEAVLAIRRWRAAPPTRAVAASHHGKPAPAPELPPTPEIDALQAELTPSAKRSLWLEPRTRRELVGFGGELDRAVSMPGWTNVWTMPIQNRIDMLATGVNTAVGVRVMGDDFDAVATAADLVAAALAKVPGAADVVADPIRGKSGLDVRIDSVRAANRSFSSVAVAAAIEIAAAGRVFNGAVPTPIRVALIPEVRGEASLLNSVPVAYHGDVPTTLGEVADLAYRDRPASVKSENGRLRSYVRFNARDRDLAALVADAQAAAASVKLPPGVHLEWTGQFEHQLRAKRTLLYIVPAVLLVILLVLYWTFFDWADALLLLLAVPGALAGGVFCQWLMGVPFSVTVWVGFVACFGMATAAGVVMLVFLRDAVARAAGTAPLTPDRLREAVVEGAVQRLRPKLLTEATMILGLAPMLWATGVGAEVVRPMAAPVLGGVLVADEVIDLFLPAAFLWVRRRRLMKDEKSDSNV